MQSAYLEEVIELADILDEDVKENEPEMMTAKFLQKLTGEVMGL